MESAGLLHRSCGMNTSVKQPRRWARVGCLTALAILVLAVAWTAALFGTAWQRTRAEDVGFTALTRDAAHTESGIPAGPSGPLRVELDFSVGEFEVRRGPVSK